MSERQELISEVKAMRIRATRKIARIRRANGVILAGSEFDPRKDVKLTSRLTTKQLLKYRDRLQEFTSRSTQFEAGAMGAPVSRETWKRFKEAEKGYNAAHKALMDRITDNVLPNGETVEQALAKRDILHPRMANPAANQFFDPRVREAMQFGSNRAVERMTKSLEKRAGKAEQERLLKEAKSNLRDMMKVINSKQLQKAIRGLTREQFVVMWNFTNFAALVSTAYEAALKDRVKHKTIMDDTSGEAIALAQWARRQ